MNKKIILINLSRSFVGEENSSFFGSIFLTKIKQADMERVMISENEKKDFYLYFDEFQDIIIHSFENILSEARKYAFNLTMSHQYVGQMMPKTYQTILGNSENIISFRVGGEDAIKLKSEFTPIFDVKDMINLAIGEIYIKIVIDGESYDPFSAETLRVLAPIHQSYKEEIINTSREKYATSIEEIKKLIEKEESTTIRSAEEKSIITGKNKKDV